MMEADWLKGKDPEAMLRLIDARLSPRRWHLLACALARRATDGLPDGPLRELVEWAEHIAGEAHLSPEMIEKAEQIEPAARIAADTARAIQRQIVLTADPDTDPDAFRHDNVRNPPPSLPLFQAACRSAGQAVEQASEAVDHAAQIVLALVQLPPGVEQLDLVRRQVVEATRVRAASSLYASSALKLKAQADEAADQDNGKNANLRYAAALQTVQKEEETGGFRHGDLFDQKQKADKKALGRYLQDLLGNPYQPYRFEAAWRTAAVVGLARAIDADRAFDRMPILADALLDADCDEEAILRHCRGTEVHAPDGPAHVRGCWVIDLILEREPACFAHPPIVVKPPPPPPKVPPPPPSGRARQSGGMAALLDALRRGEPDDKDQA